MFKNYSGAAVDISRGIKRFSLIKMLGWHDVRQRYRRSVLGPFWLTLSMGIMITTIGVVFGQIFKTPLTEFLPFLTIGVILWTFISSVINDGCMGFITAGGIIREIPLPLFVHVLRPIWRNSLILLHNLVIFAIVLLVVQRPISWIALLSIPGFMLLVTNLSWISLLLGTFCTRYRDVPQVISSALQVFFYLTPIMWMPNQIPQKTNLYLIDLNPFYHFLQVVRGPLMGDFSSQSWVVCLGIAVVGWVVTLFVYGRYQHRIPYWL